MIFCELLEYPGHASGLDRRFYGLANNFRDRQIESQTKSNPVLYGHPQIFAAFFLSLASCPDTFQIENFAVRLVIIYDLIDRLGDRSLDVLEEHAEEITQPEDLILSKSFNQDNSERARPPGHVCPAGPGWGAPRQELSLGGREIRER